MDMKREMLESYRSKKEEIKELHDKLAHLGEGDSMVGNSIINDYKKGYPRPQAVVGRDTKREARLREMYLKRIAKLEEECAAVETWIEEIQDSITRRIFRMYYIDGISQANISKRIHMSQSAVSKKIDQIFKME